MKKIVLLLAVTCFAAPAFSAECSKKAVENFVNKVCGEITEKGADVKKGWPEGLIYENCGKNYIWVQDTSPDIKMVMHPIKQAKNDSSLKEDKDKNGVKLFVEFDKTAKAQAAGGWAPGYVWPKIGQEEHKPKESFVKACKMKDGTTWVIGSGLWTEDLKK